MRRIFRGHNIRVAFRSSRTLRSILSRTRCPVVQVLKDKVPAEKQSGVVHNLSRLVASGRYTRKRLETRLKEHKDACRRGEVENSASA